MYPKDIAFNHMNIYWHDYASQSKDIPITEAGLIAKASIIGRVGLMLLSCGTGAWRVRSSMNTLAENLGITCTANIGLLSIDYTCFDGKECFSQSLCLTNTGVNTAKLNVLENFIAEFPDKNKYLSGEQLHCALDEIAKIKGLYSPFFLGLAAAFACGAFTFLLGGGLVEMICAFLGAGCGNYLRSKLLERHLTLFLCIVASVSLACLVYTCALRIAENILTLSAQHEAGYICAMLFIIPGFPFITSGVDMAKLDMRSGVERFFYAVVIIGVATITAWVVASILHLTPAEFSSLVLPSAILMVLRFIASFVGVFGFSLLFNSPLPLALAAATIGAAANTLRLELIDFTTMAPAVATFIGALTAGILAALLKKRLGYPRIALTVPSVVIMVPGLYLYRAMYNLGTMSLMNAAEWFTSAMLIIVALQLGLIFARIITDKAFRYCT